MNKESFSFVVYLIHEWARSNRISTSQAYMQLKNTGCIDSYLVPNYDVLHTMGTEYLVNDIDRYIASSRRPA